METIATNGIRLQVLQLRTESGPTALLLHGFPEGSYSWADMAGRLAGSGYQVWVPDRRGYNSSDRPPHMSAYNSEIIARDDLSTRAGARKWT
jgi:pimeloyl-ACP methyl ester carboxylesterase